MNNNLTPLKKFSWIKLITRVLLSIWIIFVSLYIYGSTKSELSESTPLESNVSSIANLDFQNKSGVVRLKSSFNDILISSEGSTKKGDGYVLQLKIVNPSSIALENITCKFWHSGSTIPVLYTDIKMSVPPGTSKSLKCFFSDLSDNNLKSINVSVDFERISFH